MEQLIQKTFLETSKALSDIYKKRKRTLFFQKIMWGIAGLFFSLMFLNLLTSYFPFIKIDALKMFKSTAKNPYASMYPVVALVVLLYPAGRYFIKAFQDFKIKEATTITKMVKTLFPKVDFTQQINAPHKQIKASKLFAWIKSSTPMSVYGQIRSTQNESTINIADIGLVEQQTSSVFVENLMRIPGLNLLAIVYVYGIKNIFTNKTADNVQFTYRGMFCWLNFKKSLNGHTVILTNNQSTKLNRYFSSSFKEEEKIELEDPRFTDQFIVYGTDQVEARYVLSTALMERIVALKEKFNQSILLSFQDKQMYLAVENKHGLFSFPAGKLDTIKIVEELANDIKTALQINTELKL